MQKENVFFFSFSNESTFDRQVKVRISEQNAKGKLELLLAIVRKVIIGLVVKKLYLSLQEKETYAYIANDIRTKVLLLFG